MMSLAILVLLAAPLAAPTGETAPRRGRAEDACVALEVRPRPRIPRAARGPWTARRIVRLDIDTRRRAGSRPVELHVLTPGGHLYQKLSPSRLQPSPRDSRLRRRQHVETARLSVAGTQITQRGLYGRWSVVPYFEGSLEPCGRGVSFSLRP